MCKYCAEGNNERLESEYAGYRVTGDRLEVDYCAYSGDSSFEEAIKINNCPMCGQRLGKVHITEGNRGQVKASKQVTWAKKVCKTEAIKLKGWTF